MNNDFEIRNGVLERYRGLAPSVDIPEGVTTIGKLAFFSCRKVWEVKLNDNIVAIDERAFANTKIRDMISLTVFPTLVTKYSVHVMWMK